MGILEIILTIFAWRNGWKWLALIPVGLAFIIGYFIGMSGASIENAVWVDIIASIALVIMIVKKKPENSEINQTKKD